MVECHKEQEEGKLHKGLETLNPNVHNKLILSFYVDLASSFDAHAHINYKSFRNLAEIISDSSEEL